MTVVQTSRKTYPAKTAFVIDATRVDLQLELGFGVSIIRPFLLDNVNFPWMRSADELDRRRAKEARHCLIILIGGKEVIADVDDDRRRQLTVIVYLPVKKFGLPGTVVDVDGESCVCVNDYMNQLEISGFSPNLVKMHLNGV